MESNIELVSEKKYAIIMFRDSHNSYSSNMKTFENDKEFENYIQSELTNYGRKEVGIWEFDSWDECIDFRINNRHLF